MYLFIYKLGEWSSISLEPNSELYKIKYIEILANKVLLKFSFFITSYVELIHRLCCTQFVSDSLKMPTRKWIDVPIHIPLLPSPNSKSANNLQGRQIDIMTYRPAWQGLCCNLRCGLRFLSSQQGSPLWRPPIWNKVDKTVRKQMLSFLERYN